MKKAILFIVLTLISILSFSDSYITRGPSTGEIYFIGPTHTGMGIYYSTNFGETAICMDSIIAGDAISIAADKTPGIIYYVSSLESFYVSYDYGQQGSWNLQNSGISHNLNSGRDEGEVYANFYSHSEDFGSTFNYHTCNGYFGSSKSYAIDFFDENVGYVAASKSNIPDSIYLFFTNDNYENLEVRKVFNLPNGHNISLTRGTESGELYMLNKSRTSLYHSYNFANDFTQVEYYNLTNTYSITSGIQEGEIFIILQFINMMWQNAHTYILHSTDYGVTFNVYHPFGKGNEPVLSNFSTLTKEVFLMEEIEFDNYSIGEINEYQWDFDNDGTVDSFDEFPTFTYQDTGYYSVSLTVVGQDSSNTFVKENYIHVIDTLTSTVPNDHQCHEVIVYPNPFTDQLVIQTGNRILGRVSIFNNTGELVRQLQPEQNRITWNGKNDFGLKCPPGIYFIRVGTSVQKVILTR